MVLSSDEIVAIGMDPGQTASFVEQSYLVSHYLLKMLKIQQQTEIQKTSVVNDRTHMQYDYAAAHILPLKATLVRQ